MVEVEVEDPSWTDTLPEAEAVAQRAAEAALAGRAGPEAAITVLLTDDAVVQDLNARFRAKDRPTNVLSFPAPETAAPHLGDVALAYGVCAAEAAAQGKTLHDHLTHLVAHGALHLLGYDHESDGEAAEMEGLEREILGRMGLADPYAKPVEGHV